MIVRKFLSKNTLTRRCLLPCYCSAALLLCASTASQPPLAWISPLPVSSNSRSSSSINNNLQQQQQTKWYSSDSGARKNDKGCFPKKKLPTSSTVCLQAEKNSDTPEDDNEEQSGGGSTRVGSFMKSITPFYRGEDSSADSNTGDDLTNFVSVGRARYSRSDAGTLTIDLPSKGLSAKSIMGTGFTAAWFSVVVPATLSGAGLIMVPFWLAGAAVAKQSIVEPFVEQQLTIGDYAWEQKATLYGVAAASKILGSRNREGPSEQLLEAKVQLEMEPKNEGRRRSSFNRRDRGFGYDEDDEYDNFGRDRARRFGSRDDDYEDSSRRPPEPSIPTYTVVLRLGNSSADPECKFGYSLTNEEATEVADVINKHLREVKKRRKNNDSSNQLPASQVRNNMR